SFQFVCRKRSSTCASTSHEKSTNRSTDEGTHRCIEFSFTVADLPGFCKVSCRTSSDVDTCGGEATVEDAISDFSCSTSDGSATKFTHDSRCTDGLNAYAHRSCYHIWISCECFRESNRYTCRVFLSSLPKFTPRISDVSIYTL